MIDRTRLYEADRHAKKRWNALFAMPWMAYRDGEQLPPWQRWRKFTHCSCYLCGNPRRHFGELTVAERRQAEKDQSERLGEIHRKMADVTEEEVATALRD